MIKNLSIEERKAIKKYLVHGDIKRIAKKLNLSNSAIHGFFNGTSNNPEILDELLKLTRKYAKNREEVASIFGKVNAKNMLKQQLDNSENIQNIFEKYLKLIYFIL